MICDRIDFFKKETKGFKKERRNTHFTLEDEML